MEVESGDLDQPHQHQQKLLAMQFQFFLQGHYVFEAVIFPENGEAELHPKHLGFLTSNSSHTKPTWNQIVVSIG